MSFVVLIGDGWDSRWRIVTNHDSDIPTVLVSADCLCLWVFVELCWSLAGDCWLAPVVGGCRGHRCVPWRLKWPFDDKLLLFESLLMANNGQSWFPAVSIMIVIDNSSLQPCETTIIHYYPLLAAITINHYEVAKKVITTINHYEVPNSMIL